MNQRTEIRAGKTITVSVCIATHERAWLLAGTLEGLSRQSRPPDEIVVSDSSESPEARNVVTAFSARYPYLSIRHIPSSRKALPWQRWWAFRHAGGRVIFFLDDDVTLSSIAVETLERVYMDFDANSPQRIAGAGFWIAFEDGTRPDRAPRSFKERWLGTSRLPSGSITPGGLTVSLAGFTGTSPVEVNFLWGGAMSFTREALAGIPLDNLVALYEAGIGRGEDAVLSSHAGRVGKLLILNQPFAVHPPLQKHDVAAPYAKNGWRLGLTQTFGRAHTMRWLATDRAAYVRDWWHLVTFELLRCLRALVCRPWQASGWKYFGGAVCGIVLTLVRWRRIPETPKSEIEVLDWNRASI